MEQTLTGDVQGVLSSVNPVVELGLGTLVLVPIIVIHGWFLSQVSQFFSARYTLYTPQTPRWRAACLTSVTIALLVVIHLIETLLWTIPIIQAGILSNFRDAYYYVLESYTTLGEGNVTLPDDWRLVGPVIAISGLFTFGWTASVLVYVMNESAKLNAARSRQQARGEGEGENVRQNADRPRRQ